MNIRNNLGDNPDAICVECGGYGNGFIHFQAVTISICMKCAIHLTDILLLNVDRRETS